MHYCDLEGFKQILKIKFLTLSLIVSFLFMNLITPIYVVDGELFAQQSGESDCDKILNQAQNLYYEGRFDESVNLIKSCLTSKELTNNERQRAYKIFSQVELARGNKTEATKIISQILKMDSAYQPTIEQETPTYVQLVDSVRSEMTTVTKVEPIIVESKGISKWWYYSAGAVVVGSTLLLLGDDDKKKDKPLDTPPEWEKED